MRLWRPEPDDELAWTAFRYVAGELTPRERAAFEGRLASDLAACEAVAEAVELAGAVKLLRPEAAPRRSPARKVLLRGAYALAATVAAVAVVATFSGREPAGRIASVPGLAEAWVRSWTPEADEELAGLAAAARDEESEAEPEHAAAEPDDTHIPSWLLASLGDEDDDGPGEPREN